MTSIGQKLTQIPTTLTEVKFEFYVKKKNLKNIQSLYLSVQIYYAKC